MALVARPPPSKRARENAVILEHSCFSYAFRWICGASRLLADFRDINWRAARLRALRVMKLGDGEAPKTGGCAAIDMATTRDARSR